MRRKRAGAVCARRDGAVHGSITTQDSRAVVVVPINGHILQACINATEKCNTALILARTSVLASA